MKIRDVFTKKGIIFLLIFVAVSLIAMNINFSQLLGAEKQYFTLFQFFGPIAAVFLGPLFGVLSVLGAELINFFWVGKAFDWINLFRLTPMLFATVYFAKYGRKNLTAAIPILCMAAFALHPVGQQVWYYSLYWLIPISATLLTKNLFLRSLGTTFTAHAIGSTVFLYSIPTGPELWAALIPIVAFERGLFALGISVSYIGMNTILAKLEAVVPTRIINIDTNYIFGKHFFKLRA